VLRPPWIVGTALHQKELAHSSGNVAHAALWRSDAALSRGEPRQVSRFADRFVGFSPEQLLAVRGKQNEALHLGISGYHVKEFLADPVGEETSQWMLDAGARLRRDYSNYFRKHHLPKPESSRRPCLVGLSKEEALAHPGCNIAGLFVYTAPRFHFSRSERVLLQHALMGETCEKVAASLFLSPWTVKKRWHAIYDRVADIDSELLPPPIAYGARPSSRGAERRRHLLNYLRQHLEELRPYASPRRRTGRSLL